jgi:hypothetical protein
MHGRRRRRHASLWLTGVAAMLVIGGAAVTVGMIRLQRGDAEANPGAAAPEAQVPARKAGQITVDLDPTSGFVAAVRGTDATRQFVTARDFSPGVEGKSGRYAGEVTAFDPGEFDGSALERGEVITVAGHDARYVADYTFARLTDGGKPHRTPLVGWQDPSGVWLLVYRDAGQKVGRDVLQRLAASVTLAPPREVRTPFRLGTVPAGLAATYVRSVEDERDGRGGTVGLSEPTRPESQAAVYAAAPAGITVSVAASGRDEKWAAEKATLTGRTTAGGHDAWYDTGRNPLSRGSTGGVLVVETDHCVIRLTAADRDQVSRADLEAMVADMAIGDCADLDTWIAPLS